MCWKVQVVGPYGLSPRICLSESYTLSLLRSLQCPSTPSLVETGTQARLRPYEAPILTTSPFLRHPTSLMLTSLSTGGYRVTEARTPECHPAENLPVRNKALLSLSRPVLTWGASST